MYQKNTRMVRVSTGVLLFYAGMVLSTSPTIILVPISSTAQNSFKVGLTVTVAYSVAYATYCTYRSADDSPIRIPALIQFLPNNNDFNIQVPTLNGIAWALLYGTAKTLYACCTHP